MYLIGAKIKNKHCNFLQKQHFIHTYLCIFLINVKIAEPVPPAQIKLWQTT